MLMQFRKIIPLDQWTPVQKWKGKGKERWVDGWKEWEEEEEERKKEGGKREGEEMDGGEAGYSPYS